MNVQEDGTWSKTDHLEGSMTGEGAASDIDFVMTLNRTHEELLRAGGIDLHAEAAHDAAVGMRDAAVDDVADDRDLQAVEMAELLPDRH